MTGPNLSEAVAALRARRAARGDADPLNRLRRIMAEGVARGQPVVTEVPAPVTVASHVLACQGLPVDGLPPWSHDLGEAGEG